MAPAPCQLCERERAVILRPKDHSKLCKTCFILAFETEIHNTITSHSLFTPGERVAIGASGGKDSTVLASVLKTLNERYEYCLDLVLLSVDEGITGYRDDSLETVKRNSVQYDLPLEIIGYKELYGWTMDEVVSQVGKKGNCTYCGVFRRQALDRGAAKLGVKHVVTGHNADDVAETVLMNLLRGDLPRLSRATSIITSSSSSPIRRSKPLKYAYEKEIVLYAHHKKLDYFSTECIYSPEAFRGSARALIKNLEKVRPSAILDIVRSGEDMAMCVPAELMGPAPSGAKDEQPRLADEEESEGGCGHTAGGSNGGEMAVMEQRLRANEAASDREIEITTTSIHGQRHDRIPARSQPNTRGAVKTGKGPPRTNKKPVQRQQMGQCERCGYMSSQAVCKACVLLEGLNRNRPKMDIEVGVAGEESSSTLSRGMQGIALTSGGPEG